MGQILHVGDCLDMLKRLKNERAYVFDPPANINFMGRDWDTTDPATDYQLPCKPKTSKHEKELRQEESFIRYWTERYAVAYDAADASAIMLAWTLPRTGYQTAVALRRAGWRIKDEIKHLFGTGMAKAPGALSPGCEGWLLATKGTLELDVDSCRVKRGQALIEESGTTSESISHTFGDPRGSRPKNLLLSHCEECLRTGVREVTSGGSGAIPVSHNVRSNHTYGEDTRPAGRIGEKCADSSGNEVIPAYSCVAGCDCGARSLWVDSLPLPTCPCGRVWHWLCPVAELNRQSGDRPGMSGGGNHLGDGGIFGKIDCDHTLYADRGGAARFFNTFMYTQKAPGSEKHAGCENLFWRVNDKSSFGFDLIPEREWRNSRAYRRGNVHPTVKPIALMRHLHRLTGSKRIVDLCAGSGSGMVAAAVDDLDWEGSEICPESAVIARARHRHWAGVNDLIAEFV